MEKANRPHILNFPIAMTPHHFGIHKDIISIDGNLIAIPEASPVSDNCEVLDLVIRKSISRFGDDIEYPCDLIITDRTLINDLKKFDCYLFLLASQEAIVDINTKYWDSELYLAEYKFLGWTISDYCGENYAFCDGFFPVRGTEGNQPGKYELEIIDKESINKFGLIKDEVALGEYVKKNKRVFATHLEGTKISEKIYFDWKVFGVFCDEFTFAKVLKLQSSMSRSGSLK